MTKIHEKPIDIDLLVHPFHMALVLTSSYNPVENMKPDMDFLNGLWANRIKRIASADMKLIFVEYRYRNPTIKAYQKRLLDYAKKTLGEDNVLVYDDWIDWRTIKEDLAKKGIPLEKQPFLRVHAYGENAWFDKLPDKLEHIGGCVQGNARALDKEIGLKTKPRILSGLTIGPTDKEFIGDIIYRGGLGDYGKEMRKRYQDKFVRKRHQPK